MLGMGFVSRRGPSSSKGAETKNLGQILRNYEGLGSGPWGRNLFASTVATFDLVDEWSRLALGDSNENAPKPSQRIPKACLRSQTPAGILLGPKQTTSRQFHAECRLSHSKDGLDHLIKFCIIAAKRAAVSMRFHLPCPHSRAKSCQERVSRQIYVAGSRNAVKSNRQRQGHVQALIS